MKVQSRIAIIVVFFTLASAYQADAGRVFIWHPGQQASYFFSRCLKESEERCVNVVYHGQKRQPCATVYFRRKGRGKDTRCEFAGASGNATLVDGQENMVVVREARRFPWLEIEGNECDAAEWESSIDGLNWNAVESSLSNPEGYFSIKEIKPQSCFYDAGKKKHKYKERTISLKKDGEILFDFGGIRHGKVKLEARGNGSLCFTVGESIAEALSDDESNYEQKALAGECVNPAWRTYSLPVRALRYLRVKSDNGDITVRGIRMISDEWAGGGNATFECSDGRLNKLFERSMTTLRSGMRGIYIDGIKRDFLPWSMDAAISSIAGDYVFDDPRTGLNTLIIALPDINSGCKDIGIPEYPLYSLIALYHHFRRFRDGRILSLYRDRIEHCVELYHDSADSDGFIHGDMWGREIGFTPGWSQINRPDQFGVAAYAQILLYLAYKDCAFLEKAIGDDEKWNTYMGYADSLKRNIISSFWDNRRMVFVNGRYENGDMDRRISPHAQVWGVISDLFPDHAWEKLFSTILPSLPGYCSDISYDKGYEMIAYAKAKENAKMFKFLSDIFGGWLEEGHMEFPEQFSPCSTEAGKLSFYGRPFGRSLCHTANGAPAVIGVMRGLLGFEYDSDNPDIYAISPDLFDLEWMKATIPTYSGKICLDLNKNGQSHMVLPGHCTLRVKGRDGRIIAEFSGSGYHSFKLTGM